MTLEAILKVLTEGQVLSPCPAKEVKGVTCDSRKVEAGFIFVAIPGALTDGHLYIGQALEKGALAVVVERDQVLEGVCQVLVPIARRALAELSRAFYGYPDRDMFMMGVTATNGKTTTTSMVHHILSKLGVASSLIGSVAYSVGEERTRSVLTTPESSDLQALFSKQREAGVEVVAMEVSSIAEAQYRVFGIDYDAVAFLNITPDHMPDHGSFDAYYAAKAQLVKGVRPGIPVILNRDDPLVFALSQDTPGQVLFIGIADDMSINTDIAYNTHLNERNGHTKPETLLYADRLRLPTGIPHFDLVVERSVKIGRGELQAGRWPVSLGIPGRHSVYNALAALLLVVSYGVGLEAAIGHLETFPGVERRLQILYDREFTLLDDHISDEDNTRKMLEALEVMTEGRPVHIIYAVRGNRGVEVNREVAAQFALFRDRINWKTFIVTNSVDVARDRDVVHPEEFAAVMEDLTAAGYDISYVPELTAAIEGLLPRVGEKEVFVLAGSHNMDRGGRIALNRLASMKAEEERSEILKVLEGRMMG